MFRVPSCPKCGGILKPFVVFFGDNVPRPRVDQVKYSIFCHLWWGGAGERPLESNGLIS